jgi:hypothetical protein
MASISCRWNLELNIRHICEQRGSDLYIRRTCNQAVCAGPPRISTDVAGSPIAAHKLVMLFMLPFRGWTVQVHRCRAPPSKAWAQRRSEE